MRATEICGEVFCEIWAVFFNRVACCPECHTSSSEMPHFDKVKCRISSNVQVWHLP